VNRSSFAFGWSRPTLSLLGAGAVVLQLTSAHAQATPGATTPAVQPTEPSSPAGGVTPVEPSDVPPPVVGPSPLAPVDPTPTPQASPPPPARTRGAAPATAPGQTTTPVAQGEIEPKREEPKKDTPWYEKIKVRGYTQIRYERIPGINRNDDLANPQGSRFLGKPNAFGIRRARLILFGDVHEHVSIYLQPDFASVIGSGNDAQFGVGIVRDWYADIFFDKKKTLRLRAGQSKVPFGFENMQSSQNRLALDRNDALNSAVKDERDLGLFLYWAPEHIRARFKHLVDSGLKGSGDYGVLAIGAYNGQTANKIELNDKVHGVLRLAWPFQFGEQFVELAAGGYWGKYVVPDQPAMSAFTTPDGTELKDARVHASLVVYPQPFGFQAEGTYGTGPSAGEFGKADANVIKSREAFGGYAQVMYKIDDVAGTVALIPYARGTYFEGGKKFESNQPHYVVKELELGIEWQIWKALEFVFAYDMADRTVPKSKGREKGHIGRAQLQFNY